MNAFPEFDKNRFEIFSKKGFKILRTNSSTNVNSSEVKDQKRLNKDLARAQREIDFIFAKVNASILSQASSILFQSNQNSVEIMDTKPLDFDPENNASDHIPIFAKVSSKNASPSIFDWFSTTPNKAKEEKK